MYGKRKNLANVTRKTWYVVILLLFMLTAVPSVLWAVLDAAANGPNPKVLVTFRDGPGDAIQSDGGGIYFDSKTEKVQSLITRIGNLYLDTNTAQKAGQGRTVWLDFSNGDVENGGPQVEGTPPDSFYIEDGIYKGYPGRAHIKTDFSELYGVDLHTMYPGETSVAAGFPLSFWLYTTPVGNEVDVDFWRIDFGDTRRGGGFPSVGCIYVTGGPDVDGDGFSDIWFIESGTDPGEDLCRLLSVTAPNTHINRGIYHMPFQIMVAKELDNAPPAVSITSPADGATFASDADIYFEASATDPEDGDITSSLVWTSNIDGIIGAGSGFFTVLSDGNHTITATATDSAGATGSDSVNITVGSAPPGPSIDSITPNTMPAGTTISVTISGSGFVAGATVTFENGDGKVPSAIVTYVNGTTITTTVTTHRKAKSVSWDVRVTNPDGSFDVLVGGFTVY